MKKTIIFLGFFILLALTIFLFTNEGLHYYFSKMDYVKNYPEQAIIPYPWDPVSPIKILPFNYEIPAVPGNNISLSACRDQFESASFIINSQKNLSGIQITVPDLSDARGNSFPADAITLRTVKVWYQAAADDVWLDHNEYLLTPELLLKDDSLVKVNYSTKTNYLRVIIDGNEHYIDISDPESPFPPEARIRDSSSLQPFSLQANENKQIWVTVQVPGNIPSGDYHGNIAITAPSEAPVMMNFSIRVLPFDLEPSPVEYALYYRGQVTSLPVDGINSDDKTSQQYSLELQNMKDHGISYPTFYQSYYQSPGIGLSLRNQIGFPQDHIYLADTGTGNSTDPTVLTNLEREITRWKKITSRYGYQEVYIYGIDEARGDVLRSERPAWETVHQNGAKVFAAVSDNTDAVNIAGDILDTAVFAGPLDATQAAQWHSYGKRVFSYANPQVGIENPEIYRRNYGFALWNAGYDGAMDYAYQAEFGPSIWNDFDSQSTHYRDHVFAYPTSNGVIDTIQWEGWREGVDDTRFLASLIKKEGNESSARALISSSLARGDSMGAIREKVIEQILRSPY